MKLTFITALFLTTSTQLFAQEKTITRDTINLSGIVLESDGKPAKYISIHSQNRVFSFADSTGHFVLNGIMLNDTLSISGMGHSKQYYTNNGSRFMTVNLPLDAYDLSGDTPVEIAGKRITPKSTVAINVIKKETPQINVVAAPDFPGGIPHFLLFVKAILHYPQKAIENNIEGTVQVMFTVKKDGTLTDFVILKGIGYGCDEAAIAMLKRSPKWRPGIQHELEIDVKRSVSINFSLKDK